jgi:Protein of unknown function (Hypoth_ymh)
MPVRSKATRLNGDVSPAGREETARSAIEARTGRPLSDAEWSRAGARLLEFATILRAWDEKSRDATETETDWSIQQGIEQILRGMYQALRNPRSHSKFSDTQEDADAIILFLNYILKQVDHSKSPFDRATFTRRLFDPLFPQNSRYAELLAWASGRR